MDLRLRLLAYSRMKAAPGCKHAPHLRQRHWGIGHVVQRADHGGAVEDSHQRRAGGRYPRPRSGSVRMSPSRGAGLFQLGAGIIQQGDLFVAGVARGVAPGARAQFQQVAAGW